MIIIQLLMYVLLYAMHRDIHALVMFQSSTHIPLLLLSQAPLILSAPLLPLIDSLDRRVLYALGSLGGGKRHINLTHWILVMKSARVKQGKGGSRFANTSHIPQWKQSQLFFTSFYSLDRRVLYALGSLGGVGETHQKRLESTNLDIR